MIRHTLQPVPTMVCLTCDRLVRDLGHTLCPQCLALEAIEARLTARPEDLPDVTFEARVQLRTIQCGSGSLDRWADLANRVAK